MAKKNHIYFQGKIIHVFNYYSPNLGYIENCLPKKEAQNGNRIVILLPKESQSTKGLIEDTFFIDKYKDIWSNMIISEPLYIKSSILNKFRIIMCIRPDIITSPCINICVPFLMAFKYILGYKLVGTMGMPVKLNNLNLSKRILYSLSKVFYFLFSGGIDLFIEATQENISRDVREFDINPDKIKFLPLGSDMVAFNQDDYAREILRNKYQISPSETLFIYAGKLSAEKNIHILVESFAQLATQRGNIRLMIVGNGSNEYITMIKSIIDKNHIRESVFLLDFACHQDLPMYYNAADVGIWPGSPSITIQEAMACGLPIILYKSLHTNHLIKYANGYEFTKKDELIEYMDILASNQDKREDMGKLSRKLVEDELNWDSIAQKFVLTYKYLYDK